MRIQVTQEHIDRGREQISAAHRRPVYRICPVALALADAGFRDPRVYPDTFWVWTGGGIIRKVRNLPREVAAWISAFDAKRNVEPFSFEIEDLTP
jgi:hypothetical protein